jgi:hypothetical protein
MVKRWPYRPQANPRANAIMRVGGAFQQRKHLPLKNLSASVMKQLMMHSMAGLETSPMKNIKANCVAGSLMMTTRGYMNAACYNEQEKQQKGLLRSLPTQQPPPPSHVQIGEKLDDLGHHVRQRLAIAAPLTREVVAWRVRCEAARTACSADDAGA